MNVSNYESIGWRSINEFDFEAGKGYQYFYPELGETVYLKLEEPIHPDCQTSYWFNQSTLMTIEFKSCRLTLGVSQGVRARLLNEDKEILVEVSPTESVQKMKAWISNDKELAVAKQSALRIDESNVFQVFKQGSSSAPIELKVDTLKAALMQILLYIEDYCIMDSRG